MKVQCGRMINAGRITNHEMGDLRKDQVFHGKRRSRLGKRSFLWLYCWGQVSQDFHPRSEQEWKDFIEKDDD